MPGPDDGFDAARGPVITYRVSDTDRPDMVCTWRWWGPSVDWDVLGTVARVGTALVLERLTVLPHGRFDLDEDDDAFDPSVPPPGSVTPSVLKAIPLGRLMAQVHADLLQRAASEPADEQWARHVREVVAAERSGATKRAGRPSLSHDLLRDVAIAYLEEAQHGRGLTERLAVRFDRPAATIRDWIRAARREQFLTAAEPGRVAAAPGWRLLDELYAGWTPLEGTPFETTAAERAEAVKVQRHKPFSSDQPPF